MNRRSLPAAVLFDMDGTLVSTQNAWQNSVKTVAALQGIPIGESDLVHVHGHSVHHVARHLSAITDGEISPRRLEYELTEEFAAAAGLGFQILPGVREILAELKFASVPTALVSAAPRKVVNVVLSVIGENWFDLTLASEDTQNQKPAPDPYLTAVHLLGVHAPHCVVVEDSPVGVASGLAAGCRVLAVPSSLAIAPDPDVVILDSLEQVSVPFLASLVASAETP